MADKRDYYEVLGVSKDADDATLKKAYRELAKKYHPDTHPGDAEAEAKFKEASEAYSVLSDSEKRQQYDQFGHAAFDGSGGAGAGGFGGFSGFGGFGDIFGDIFNMFGGGGNPNEPMKGANVRASVRVSFEEACFGCEKDITLNLKDACPKCNGTGAKPGTTPVSCGKCGGRGQVTVNMRTIFGMSQSVQTCPDCGGKGKIVKEKCPDCYGSGYITSRKTIKVTIPAGINDGQSIRLQGKGEPGENGGPRGDLMVEVVVSKSSQFERNGTTISSTVPISFADAALGATIRIKTIDGEVEYDVKPGTQPGTVVRLSGKGVASLRNPSTRGDHFVTLEVQVPKHLNEAQRKALIEFDTAMNGSTKHEEKKKKKLFG